MFTIRMQCVSQFIVPYTYDADDGGCGVGGV